MKSSLLTVCALVVLALVANAHAAGYKAGAADSVKGWPTRDFENAKTAGLPLCVYFYNPENNNNSRAKYIEGPDLLANADVKSSLKGFLSLKVKTDGSDAKGWPAEILSRAGKGGAVMLASGDMSQIFFFDNTMQMSDIKPAMFVQQAAGILNYEKKNPAAKKEEEKEKKGAMPPPPEEKKGVPGLALDNGKGDKKDEKKPPEKKKPVAPADE
jgi:hypothetical protein